MRKARSFLKKVLPVSFASGLLAGVALTSVAVAISGSAIFQDVPAGSYYSDAVGRMYSLGIIKGKDDTHFDPAGTLTRADAAVLMDRLYTKLNGSVASSSSSSRSSSSSSSSSSSVSSSSSSSSSQATVGDAGGVHFSQREYNIDKNDAIGKVDIVIARLGKNTGAVTVDYSFSGSTAVSGKDFDAISGTLSFATHESSKKLTVKIYNNTSATGTRKVNLVLSKPTGGVVIDSPATAVLNINDPNVSSSSSSGGSSSAAVTGPVFAF
ncbi:MAG TPA: Calx-beta domain-containing protein, partial [Candidatus Peribacteria bacterium]|nr:Calx-beta domain-containing protein [Candidatus Peribacteria bacterium]